MEAVGIDISKLSPRTSFSCLLQGGASEAMFKGLVLCTAFAVVSAVCPTNIPSQKVFDTSKFMGRWYLISTYKMVAPEDTRCGSYVYELNSNETQVTVTEQGIISPNSTFSQTFNTTVNATVPSQWSADSLDDEYHFHTLLTDYNTFAAYYLCISYPWPYAENWVTTAIMSRQRVLSADTVHVLETLLSGYGFDISEKHVMNQTNC